MLDLIKPVSAHSQFMCVRVQTHRVSGDGRGWVDTVSVPLFAANASLYVAISPLRDGSFGK